MNKDKPVKTRKVLDITKDEHNIHFDIRLSFPSASKELEKDILGMKDKFINGGEYDEAKDIYFNTHLVFLKQNMMVKKNFLLGGMVLKFIVKLLLTPHLKAYRIRL